MPANRCFVCGRFRSWDDLLWDPPLMEMDLVGNVSEVGGGSYCAEHEEAPDAR